ncbi:hypothetical protein M2322_000809 [Rhodoblastus acidophilus]|uniref:hypothetical protein n=1 Tax=Rhodoblastus acidophilus TaxID=1074 RepID=UPI0022240D2D|nr:hypothetical protein [Rhodoblastus acidophilus]MCW2315275.1 hypothetical protein [Rhodoblastus acidophilus]
MCDLPALALSIRQPWAWAIIAGHKPVENRSQGAVRFMEAVQSLRAGDWVAVHAAKGMTRDEYMEGADFMWSRGIVCPEPAELLRGGIIGSVRTVGVASNCEQCPSLWFFGPRGILLERATPCDFIPAVGALGLFKWKPAGPEIVPKPAKWMLPDDTPSAAPEETLL